MVGGKPLYTAFPAPLVKVKVIFWKALASDAPPRTNIIYTPKTDCSLRVLARPSHKTAVARDELAVYAVNSLENFVRISCSRQKVVRLFRKSYHFFPYQLFPSPYQLFPLLYQLFPLQGTPIPRTRTASSFSSMAASIRGTGFWLNFESLFFIVFPDDRHARISCYSKTHNLMRWTSSRRLPSNASHPIVDVRD